ncbi:helix-turn-helix domain-containing protein [Canibacter zhoujuaniae]|uniref:helix-turn-helix domain-containing protein n=1 Tax=Canibacter zhoujuaniae TaxID=2708343 RepID=UPI00141D9EDE|nr:helix-turn-helix transcriptional regulator [Canibacter zhoujuaniae]
MVLLREQLGDVLRDFRTQQNQTLRAVSGEARVAPGYLSEIERGQKEVSSEILLAVSTALQVPLSVILNEVSERVAMREQLNSGVSPIIPDTVPADLLKKYHGSELIG